MRAKVYPEWWQEIKRQFSEAVADDLRQSQIAYYTPANPKVIAAHTSRAREIALSGGNRSSKTTTMLAELVIQATNHIPLSLMDVYPREKLRGPIRARIVCNSLTDTLEPVIKPKLRWDQWSGAGTPGDGRGHWGLIPKHCLAGGTWEKAYSDRTRTLHVAVDSFWQGPNGEVNSMRGHSSIQCMSFDQDLSAFSGSSLHFVGHDELPPADIYRENRMRTLDVRGQIYTAFTPPDEPGMMPADVTWFHDYVFERGLPGPGKDPLIDSLVLFTEDNRVLDPRDIEEIFANMTEEQRETRQHGRFMHLAGVIYKLFVDYEGWWCFRCRKKVIPVAGTCATCAGDQITIFTHVIEPFEVPRNWPVIFVIDPHLRKKDAMGWFVITPSDDLLMIGELSVDGEASDVARAVRDYEAAHRVSPAKRLMDPNIATETNDKLRRGWTIRQAYDEVGLRCDLANDEVNVGIGRVNEYLKPDPITKRPRFQVFSTCEQFIYGMKHWTWAEWTRQQDREPKERVRDKAKDFPDLIRYLVNDRPTFAQYTRGLAWAHRPVRRSGVGY